LAVEPRRQKYQNTKSTPYNGISWQVSQSGRKRLQGEPADPEKGKQLVSKTKTVDTGTE